MTSPATDRARADRIGKELGKQLVWTALYERWDTKRWLVLQAAADYLERYAATMSGSEPPDLLARDRATRIGYELSRQLVRAVSASPSAAPEQLVSISAAARHLRFYLKQLPAARKSLPPAELWDEQQRN